MDSLPYKPVSQRDLQIGDRVVSGNNTRWTVVGYFGDDLLWLSPKAGHQRKILVHYRSLYITKCAN